MSESLIVKKRVSDDHTVIIEVKGSSSFIVTVVDNNAETCAFAGFKSVLTATSDKDLQAAIHMAKLWIDEMGSGKASALKALDE